MRRRKSKKRKSKIWRGGRTGNLIAGAATAAIGIQAVKTISTYT